MPKYREIFIKKEARIIVWKILETETELRKLIYNSTFIQEVETRKSQSSRKQFLASRIILEQEGLAQSLSKDSNGKPTVPNKHISITHDHEYVAIMISLKECGLDLQSISEKVLRVKHKFIDDDDLPLLDNELNGLTLAWCVKEAIYKINGDPLIYFKEHMRITGVYKNKVQAKILHPDYLKDVTLETQKIDEIYLAYTI